MSRYTHQTILYVGLSSKAFADPLSGLTQKWRIDGNPAESLMILSLDDPTLGNTGFQIGDATRLYVLGHGTERGEKICAEFSGGLFTLSAVQLADRLRIFLRSATTTPSNPVKINLLMCMGAHTPTEGKNSFAENLLIALQHHKIHAKIIARPSLLGINKHTGRKQTFTEECKERFIEKKGSFFSRRTARKELVHANLEPSKKVCLVEDNLTAQIKITALPQKPTGKSQKNTDELMILLNAFIASSTSACSSFSFFGGKKRGNAEDFIRKIIDAINTQQFETLPALIENAKSLDLPLYLLEDLKNFDLVDAKGEVAFTYTSNPS